MLTIAQSLGSLSLYPINPISLNNIIEEEGLTGTDDATTEVRQSTAYRRAKARVYMYLALAPSVSEAGATYSFSEDERNHFRSLAQVLFNGEDDNQAGGTAGCVGEDF